MRTIRSTAKPHDSLETAFTALWADMQRQTDDRPGIRQAFKNGASLIGAWHQTRGDDAIEALIMAGEEAILAAVWPWVAVNLKRHPEWHNSHRDAVVAGVFAALVLIRVKAPLLEQISNFNIELLH